MRNLISLLPFNAAKIDLIIIITVSGMSSRWLDTEKAHVNYDHIKQNQTLSNKCKCKKIALCIIIIDHGHHVRHACDAMTDHPLIFWERTVFCQMPSFYCRFSYFFNAILTILKS